MTHAIDIASPAEQVWPWLAQMGAGRAGWYSYDWIDNRGRRSATRIVPELQAIHTGDVLPAYPGARHAFVVVECQPPSQLVLVWRSRKTDRATVTWTVVVEEREGGSRLIERLRVSRELRPLGLGAWAWRSFLWLGHEIMTRKHLRGIARRVAAGQIGPAAET